jgi:HEAT repeat protein
MNRARHRLLFLTGAFVLVTVAPESSHAKKAPPLSARRDTLEHYVEDLIKYLKPGTGPHRSEAEYELRALGPRAKAAVPALIEALKGKDLRGRRGACDVLAAIGPDAKPALPLLLQILEGPEHPKTPLYGYAAYALGRIGPAAKAALPALSKIMNDPNAEARIDAADAFARISGDRRKVSTIFIDILLTRGESWQRRRQAAAFFLEAGADVRRATPALREVVRDPKEDPFVVPEAAFTLWKIEQNKEAVRALLRVLKSESKGDRTSALYLADIGPPAREAIPVLLERLRRSAMALTGGFRGERESLSTIFELFDWADCLGQFGPDAKQAASVLRPLLKHEIDYLQLKVARALWRIDRSPEALTVLKQLLADGWPSLRMDAARVLHEFGKFPKESLPRITALLRHNDFAIREEAAELLRKIDPKSAKKLLGK